MIKIAVLVLITISPTYSTDIYFHPGYIDNDGILHSYISHIPNDYLDRIESNCKEVPYEVKFFVFPAHYEKSEETKIEALSYKSNDKTPPSTAPTVNVPMWCDRKTGADKIWEFLEQVAQN